MDGVVEMVRPGRPASEALAAAIATAKAAGALRPVTVVVPSNFAGLSARRWLGTRGRGIANVHFLTPFRLAELLAADRLGDSRPLTNPVLGAAVRQSLAADPGPFGPVAHHHATESALAALYAELSAVSPAVLTRLEAHGPAPVRLYRAIAARLAGFHDESALTRAAAARPDLVTALQPFGPIIWFLPEPTTPPITAFLRAVFQDAPVQALVGVTGAREADAAVGAMVTAAGLALPNRVVESHSEAPPVADSIISVTDSDEEVRAVLRRVVDLVGEGVALDRIGVFYPTPDPYRGILAQHLAGADVPANGPSRRRLADTIAGRVLLAALALPAQRWRRDRVLALASSGPLRIGDDIVRPTVWETLSRQAGVVQDLGDWSHKLGARRAWLDGQLVDLDPFADHNQVDHINGEIADIDALNRFVDELAETVMLVEQAEGWPARAAAARHLLHRLVGPGHLHSTWPEADQEAFERVEDTLARLGTLDELEPLPSLEVFVRALRAELDVTRGRNGRFGQGLVYGPLASAGGHDLDAVFILGCAEGLLPPPRREDSLLSDEVRRHAGGELELRGSRLHHQHRQFLSALSAAPVGRRTLTFPRGDLRGSRELLPSRWLLDTASALAGQQVHTTEFHDLVIPGLTVVPSHQSGVVTAPVAGSLVEHDLAVVARHVATGSAVLDAPAARRVGRGIWAQAERRSSRFTQWDGNLAGQPIPSAADRPLSPSRLEDWAACGYRYFLAHVLGLRDRDDPERVIDLDPLNRGTAMHDILETFIQDAIDNGPPDPHEPWSADGRARLVAIANAVFDATEERGLTGRDLHWKIQREELVTQLLEFLVVDDQHRAASRSHPFEVELAFGEGPVDPVRLRLADGRVLQFRGRVDRIDVDVDGRLLVSDYKTGSGTKYRGIHDDDPVQGGRTLQLGLYAEAAHQLLEADEVSSHYWIVGNPKAPGRHGYDWTPDRRQRMFEVLEVIADGIQDGVFPVVPGDWDSWRSTYSECAYCAFDQVCSRARGEHADAKAGAPQLEIRRPLTSWGDDP
ncbi:MAG: hypothetical protein GY713_22455 [Actinomycetia bacterium]|nr:hypothetical protein [Actinomycetes bacterium]